MDAFGVLSLRSDHQVLLPFWGIGGLDKANTDCTSFIIMLKRIYFVATSLMLEIQNNLFRGEQFLLQPARRRTNLPVRVGEPLGRRVSTLFVV